MRARGHHRRCRAAFTLIEIVVSLAVLGFVATVTAGIFFEGISDYHRVANRTRAVDQVRLAMERITRELRHVAEKSGVDGTPDIDVTVSNGGRLRFYKRVSGGSPVLREVKLSDAGDGLELWVDHEGDGLEADDAHMLVKDDNVSITFTYYKGDGTVVGALDAGTVADVRRIGVEIELPVAASRLAQAEGVGEPAVKLTSSCYIRNLAGELQ